MPNQKQTAPVADIAAALTLLSTITAEDLAAVHKAHGINYKFPPPPSMFRRSTDVKPIDGPPRLPFTMAERKLRKNERQRLSRATPEGRAYANEASKKSTAAKKLSEAAQQLMAERVLESIAVIRKRGTVK